jgi:hypothetical protein
LSEANYDLELDQDLNVEYRRLLDFDEIESS